MKTIRNLKNELKALKDSLAMIKSCPCSLRITAVEEEDETNGDGHVHNLIEIDCDDDGYDEMRSAIAHCYKELIKKKKEEILDKI